jgi:hypothetical protein
MRDIDLYKAKAGSPLNYTYPDDMEGVVINRDERTSATSVNANLL